MAKTRDPAAAKAAKADAGAANVIAAVRITVDAAVVTPRIDIALPPLQSR
jgi:hypothetical protein